MVKNSICKVFSKMLEDVKQINFDFPELIPFVENGVLNIITAKLISSRMDLKSRERLLDKLRSGNDIFITDLVLQRT
jgi:hypothetical protein